MPLSQNLSLTTLFGPSAKKEGAKENCVLTIKLSELGVSDNISSPEDLTPEGIVLALLQKINSAQGEEKTRVLEVTKDLPGIVIRGGDPAKFERYSVKVHSGVFLPFIDPTDI